MVNVFEMASASVNQPTKPLASPEEMQKQLSALGKRYDILKKQHQKSSDILKQFQDRESARKSKKISLSLSPSLHLQETLVVKGQSYNAAPKDLGFDKRFDRLAKLLYPIVTIANALIRDPVNTEKLFEKKKVLIPDPRDPNKKIEKVDENNKPIILPNVFEKASAVVNTLLSNPRVAELVDKLGDELDKIDFSQSVTAQKHQQMKQTQESGTTYSPVGPK